MNFRLKTTASLLAALASGQVLGCSASADDPTDPNASGSGGDGPDNLAPPASADIEFLTAYAETDRFRSGQPRSIEVLPDGSGVLFLRSGARDKVGALYFFDAASSQEREVLTVEALLQGNEEELSAEELARRERMRVTARGIASFRLSPNGSQILVPLSGRLFLVDRAALIAEGENPVRELDSPGAPAIDPRFSPDGRSLALVRDGDLYVVDLAAGVERRLTHRASDEIENGLAEFVAQEEMDRMRGFWWSPDSRTICYQQTDTTPVERMHVADPLHPESLGRTWPYPRPGKDNALVRLGLISAAGGATRWIDWDRERFEYLAAVRWSAGGPLTILLQDREQENETLFSVEPGTGAMTELLSEHDEAWINIDSSVPVWLEDGSSFLWSSEREGAWRLELRSADGALVRALAPEGFGYRSVFAVDQEHRVAWISASEEPTEAHIYRVALGEPSDPVRVTEEPGVHRAAMNGRGGLWVHRRETESGELTFDVRAHDGSTVGTIASAAEDPGVEPNVSFETIGEREWRVAIVRPRDFDEDVRYPVILYVYGGPHAQQVTRAPSRYLFSQWQADHNFIVVAIDGRGTPHRGRAWERTIDGDFISAPLEDQIEALQGLGDRHHELDLSRVGVWGWSFGGYFSAMATLRRPDFFVAGVAGAPVSEWRDYDTHYTERYIGLPEDADTEGPYRVSSVLTYATEAPLADHRPLLIIHGTADDNVYFSHSLRLQDTLLRASRPGELLALSGITHMVASDPEVMRRMHQRIIAFFEAHLRDNARVPAQE